MLHIETFSYDDYDEVIRFLLEHDIPIIYRNKLEMVVVAEMSEELADQMKKEVNFYGAVLIDKDPQLR